MLKSKIVKLTVASAILFGATTVTNGSISVNADEVVSKKDKEDLKGSKVVVDKDAQERAKRELQKVEEEKRQNEDRINESLRKLEEYESEVSRIAYDKEQLASELEEIKTSKVVTETNIKENESKVEDYNKELLKLAEEKSGLEKEKETNIDLLNDRIKVFFKNSKNESIINMLEEGKTVNESLENNKKMGDIADKDVEVIEKIIKNIKDIQDKEELIKGKVEELNKVLETLHKEYKELEDLEIKKKVLENELNLETNNIKALIESEEISVKTLQEKIKGLETTEQGILNAQDFANQTRALEEYREYQKQYRESLKETENRLEKEREKLSELLQRENDASKLLSTYRDTVYELKEYDEDLILERETKLDKKQDKIKDLEEEVTKTKSKESKNKIEKELETKVKDYEKSVFNIKLIDDINNKKFTKVIKESKIKDLKAIEDKYKEVKLTTYEKESVRTLKNSIKSYEKELKVFKGEGAVIPTYGKFTYGFGPRNLLQGETYHYGIDIANSVGTPIVSVLEGTVVRSGYVSEGYGNYVFIEHQVGGKTITTGYGHMSVRNVKVGDKVEKGDVIGLMGNTGWSTGPHLHFEVYFGKKHGWSYTNIVNPVEFLGTSSFTKSKLMTGK